MKGLSWKGSVSANGSVPGHVFGIRGPRSVCLCVPNGFEWQPASEKTLVAKTADFLERLRALWAADACYLIGYLLVERACGDAVISMAGATDWESAAPEWTGRLTLRVRNTHPNCPDLQQVRYLRIQEPQRHCAPVARKKARRFANIHPEDAVLTDGCGGQCCWLRRDEGWCLTRIASETKPMGLGCTKEAHPQTLFCSCRMSSLPVLLLLKHSKLIICQRRSTVPFRGASAATKERLGIQ